MLTIRQKFILPLITVADPTLTLPIINQVVCLRVISYCYL